VHSPHEIDERAKKTWEEIGRVWQDVEQKVQENMECVHC
jgi:hypothetical protein